MEDPATWTKAERVVSEALFGAEQARADGVIGLSTARRITDALRREGLLHEPTVLSALLFNARELLDMYGSTVFQMTDRRDRWVYGTRDQIDAYRAERGWSPNGYGGEG
jgi:hypothetical protein